MSGATLVLKNSPNSPEKTHTKISASKLTVKNALGKTHLEKLIEKNSPEIRIWGL